jgi:hypothetical protein
MTPSKQSSSNSISKLKLVNINSAGSSGDGSKSFVRPRISELVVR